MYLFMDKIYYYFHRLYSYVYMANMYVAMRRLYFNRGLYMRLNLEIHLMV